MKRVVILGASPKKDRYSNKAQAMLQEYGYEAIPVAPAVTEIDGVAVHASLSTIEGAVDTLTLYMNPTRSLPLLHDIIQLAPRRVIMNPGTESGELAIHLREAGIMVQEACTLVLLRTGQF